MSVLTYKRYARLSLRKYRKSFGWPVVDNFLAIIYTCGPAWVIRITFSLIPCSSWRRMCPTNLLPPYSLSRSITILKFRSCVKYDAVASRRANNAAMILISWTKVGARSRGMGLFQSTLCVPRDLLTDFELTMLEIRRLISWKKFIGQKKKKRKILFHLELLKTFFYFFVDKIRIITKKEENIPNFNN